jgi:SNF2 family DNA or RNA helicase
LKGRLQVTSSPLGSYDILTGTFHSSPPYDAGKRSSQLTEEEALLFIDGVQQALRPFLLGSVNREVEAELPDNVEKVVKCKLAHK